MQQLGFTYDATTNALSVPQRRTERTRDEELATFLLQHDWFENHVIKMAREHKLQGNKRWSMRAIWELSRHLFKKGPKDRHGLPNVLAPAMARRVMRVAPDLAGFFETIEKG